MTEYVDVQPKSGRPKSNPISSTNCVIWMLHASVNLTHWILIFGILLSPTIDGCINHLKSTLMPSI